MSRRSQSKQQPRLNVYFAATIGLVVIVLIAIFAARGTAVAGQSLSPADYQTQFIASGTDHFLLDVRTADEFNGGHIHGAANIPVDALKNRLSEVPTDKPVIVYCRSGNRSAQASQILAQAGYTYIYDLGGLNDWTAQGFPVE